MNRASWLSVCALVLLTAATCQTYAQGEPPGRRGGGGFGRREHGDPMRQGKPADIPAILKRAFEAGPKLRYAGERTIEFRRGSQRKSHKESVWKDGPRIKIWFPADSEFAGQVIVEDEDSREHYFPSRNEIEVMGPRREETLSKLMEVVASNRSGERRFVMDRPESVAGVRCVPVGIKGKEDNVFLRMWIEPRSGAILKRALYDPSGAVVGSMEFSRIDLTPTFKPGDFTLRIPSAKRLSPEDLARRLMKEKNMLEVFLPGDEGFKLDGSRMLGFREKPTLVLFYQGPKGRISLHQVAGVIDAERLQGLAGRNFKVYAWQARGRTFALIGDLDASELQRIANKIRF